MSKNGNVTTILGIPGYCETNDRDTIHFANGICIDENDMLYYADSGHSVIIRYDLKNGEKKIIAGQWSKSVVQLENRSYGDALTSLFE